MCHSVHAYFCHSVHACFSKRDSLYPFVAVGLRASAAFKSTRYMFTSSTALPYLSTARTLTSLGCG